MLNWFCAYTRPQQEARAAIELTNQDFRVFLPVLYTKPMFPRYIFVQFDRDKDPWGKVRNTRGCIDLLRDGFIPSVVPTFAIEAIMAFRPPQEPEDGLLEFRLGDTVRIQGGVLDGLQGLFQADVKGRTQALIEIMGRKVTVPRNSVRAA